MDQLRQLGIGPPGERGSIYRRWLALINEAESQNGGIRKGWPEPAVLHFRKTYAAFLQVYPWFCGYWIRYARAEFRLGNTNLALSIYENGLEELPYSPDLWAAYLQFLTIVSHDTKYLDAAFEKAIAYVGDDFYSHVVYDVYIEYLDSRGFSDQKRALLEFILTKTLHQFSKYFVLLNDNSFLNKYYVQQDRVAQAWKYECQLHRPTFFHPKPLKQQERAVWLHYLDSQIEDTAFKTQLFRRLLVCGALDESLHLRYIRWLIAKRESPLQAFAAADRQLPADLIQVRLYFALWLEYTGKLSQAADLYARIGPAGAVQASQFAIRHQSLSPNADSQTILTDALSSPDLSVSEKVAILKELTKYDENAFDSHPMPDSPEYWQAYLATRPDRGEHIYLHAPDGVITAEYLALLARTDVVKYVELDRTLHRTALGN